METTTEGLINDLVTKIFEELSGLEAGPAPQDDDGLFDTVDHAVEAAVAAQKKLITMTLERSQGDYCVHSRSGSGE